MQSNLIFKTIFKQPRWNRENQQARKERRGSLTYALRRCAAILSIRVGADGPVFFKVRRRVAGQFTAHLLSSMHYKCL